MKKKVLASAILATLALPVLLAACGKSMANKELDNPNRDDTTKAMKKAGAGDE